MAERLSGGAAVRAADRRRAPFALTYSGGRSNWPGKAHREVGGLDKLLRQRLGVTAPIRIARPPVANSCSRFFS